MTVFCLSPLGWIFDAKDRQKTEMLLNLGLFVGRILTVLLCGMLQFTFYFTLLLYGLLGCLFWLVEGVFIFHLCQSHSLSCALRVPNITLLYGVSIPDASNSFFSSNLTSLQASKFSLTVFVHMLALSITADVPSSLT